MIKKHYPQKSESLATMSVHLIERRITCITASTLIEAISRACVERRKITVAHYNVHGFNLSMQIPWFYNFLQSADIVHCDGSGILKALSYMGLKLPTEYRVSYTALMPKLLEHCNQQHFSIFLLGSKPQYLELALERLRKQYPNSTFDGHHGYFSPDDPNQNELVIQQINLAKPHILIVGMGMPIQENWIQKHRSRLNVNVIMPGGAVIDRLAGVVSECPTFISNLSLEWLYRLCREPKRLAARYLLGNPAFIFHVALAKFYASPLKIEYMQPVIGSSQKAEDNTIKLSSTTSETQSECLANVHIDSMHLDRNFVGVSS
jgi:N-acetylglucosaminyldiphosphoundecaprenol N-acetyl-beta-D-mannosaminyltransferase